MLVLGSSAWAQTQKFTMAEAVNGLRTNLAVKNISQFSWANDGKSYIQAVKGGYLITDLKTNKQDTLVSLTQLNRSLSDAKLKAVPQIKFIGSSNGYFSANDKMFWIEKSGNDWKVKTAAAVDENASNVKMFGDNQTFAFTVKNNLYVSKNGKALAVTNDADENIINGGATVHRNEFGIDTGIFPAPNSEAVAFYRMDQTMVADYPVIDWSVTPAVNHNVKYPMAGQKSMK